MLHFIRRCVYSSGVLSSPDVSSLSSGAPVPCDLSLMCKVPIVKGTEFQLHMHNLDVIAHCSKLISLNNNAGEVSLLEEICQPKQQRLTCSPSRERTAPGPQIAMISW